MNEKCNGWKNYPTWVCALWLSEWGLDDPLRAGYGTDPAHAHDFAEYLRGFLEESADEIRSTPGVLSDLLGFAINCIDFDEIAENFYYDIEQPPED